MKTQNIMIKAQDGSRIPYSNILSISPTRCGSGPNDFAIVAIFNTENKAHPKDVLFTGTEKECNDWLEWLERELNVDFPEDSIFTLKYPEKTVWSNGHRISKTKLIKIKERMERLHKEWEDEKKRLNKNTTIFDRVKVPQSEEYIEAEQDWRKYVGWGIT